MDASNYVQIVIHVLMELYVTIVMMDTFSKMINARKSVVQDIMEIFLIKIVSHALIIVLFAVIKQPVYIAKKSII